MIKKFQVSGNVFIEQMKKCYKEMKDKIEEINSKGDCKEIQEISNEQWIQFMYWACYCYRAVDRESQGVKQVCVLGQISHIKFINLRQLNLFQCHLKSIEALSWLQSPNLVQILLYDNQITSLKPLSKGRLQKLQLLDITYNPYIDSSIINLTKIKNNKKLKNLSLRSSWQINVQSLKDNFKSNFTQIFKIQSCSLRTTFLYTNLSQKKLLRVLEKKFCNFEENLVVFVDR